MFLSLLKSLTGAEYNSQSSSSSGGGGSSGGSDSARSSVIDGARTSPRMTGASESAANDVVFGQGFASSPIPFFNVYALSILVTPFALALLIVCFCLLSFAVSRSLAFVSGVCFDCS